MENNLEVGKSKYSVTQMIIVFVILTAIYSLRNRFFEFLSPDFFENNNGSLVLAIVGFIIALICVHFANKFTGKNSKIFINRVKQGKTLWITFFFVLSVIIFYLDKINSWIQTMQKPLITIVIVLLQAIAAGLCEEFLFRDLFFNILTKIFLKFHYVLVWSAIISSFGFGLMHFINLDRQGFAVTTQQVIIATAIGLMMCTVRVLTNNIWPSVIMHIAFDVSPIVLTGDISSPWLNIMIAFIWIAGISLLCIWAYNHHCLKESSNLFTTD